MRNSDIEQVIALLRAAKRPLVHVGQGVRIAGAIPEFFQFVESWGIPFVTARNANDICASDHPLFVGRPGTFGQRGANFAVQTCDLYLAIGTRLSLTQTGYNTKDYARNAVIVQVDIEQGELDKGTLSTPIRVCADAKRFIKGMLLGLSDHSDWSEWAERCASWKRRFPVVEPSAHAQNGSVNAYAFIDTLSDALTPEDTIVTDMGLAFQVTHQAFKVKLGQRLMTNCGLAPMGWGLPAAIGAAFATGRRVICITGDGGLMMNIQELATVAHHRLPIKIFVLNNGGYLTIKQTQQLGFGGRLMGVDKDTGLSFPDFMTVGAAFHMRHMCIVSHEKLYRLENALLRDDPVLCELMIDPDQPQAPRSLNRRNADGTMNPTPLEDSWPFLDREVIEREMRLE